ncbi:MAG TPA: aquaporin [Actinomycetota bacterium]|nr:aquaporin [Actinomycetota bacterium]
MSDVAIGSGAGATAPAPAEEGQASLGRRLLSEFIGTTLFVAIGTGVATAVTMGVMRKVGGVPDQVLEQPGQLTFYRNLFDGGFGDTLAIAFAFATALAVLVYALGGVSGAHFNPAVTISLAVARRFRWADVAPYVIVQCIGGIAGAFIIAGIYGESGASFSDRDIFFGATTVPGNVEFVNALLAEAFIGFILVTAIMAIAVDPRAPKGWSGLVIGLGLAAGILATAAATGGSANLARSLGPFVASIFYGDVIVGEIPWKDLLVYGFGPLIGGMAAALVYESVTGLETVAPAPRPGAATPPGDEIIGDNGLIDEAGATSDEVVSDDGLLNQPGSGPGGPPPYNPPSGRS